MANRGVCSAIAKALIAHLKTKLPSVQGYSEDFPAPNQALAYPAITVFSKYPKLQNGIPYVIKKTVDVSGKTAITRVVGIYDIRLQLDIWAATKPERNQLLEDVMGAMNPSTSIMGLNLTLTDYFSQKAHLFVLGFDFPDSESGSQRSEWRARIDLQADAHAVAQELEYVIETIENTLVVSDTELTPLDEEPGEQTI